MSGHTRNISGPFIRKNRISAGFSQFELSVALEVDSKVTLTQSDISEIERGVRQVSDFELLAFAKVLNVPMEALVESITDEAD